MSHFLAELRRRNVLRMAGRMLYYDPALLVDQEGQPVPLHQMPEEIRAAVAGVKVTVNDVIVSGEVVGKQTTYDYKMVDRVATLDKVMKHLGLFDKHNKQLADPIRELLAKVYDAESTLPLAGNIEPLPPKTPQPGAEHVADAVVVSDGPLPDFENPYRA